MTKKQRMKKALKHWEKIVIVITKAIEKHKEIRTVDYRKAFTVDDVIYDYSSFTCPLCYIDEDDLGYTKCYNDEEECPIYTDTERNDCNKTPWYIFSSICNKYDYDLISDLGKKELKEAAQIEYDYLLNVAYSQGLI